MPAAPGARYVRTQWGRCSFGPALPIRIEAIKFRMDQQGLRRKDLLHIFGTTGRISEVLSGRRSLTLDMVRKLHFGLGIPLDSLIVQDKRRKGEALDPPRQQPMQ